MCEPQGGVAGDRVLALNDLRDAVCRYFQLTRKLRRRDAQQLKFLREDFTRMDGSTGHGHLSVIIDYLDIPPAFRTFWPFEADPPLLIYTNAELTRPPAFQSFEVTAPQSPSIIERRRSLQDFETAVRLIGKFLKLPYELALSEQFRSPVVKTDNQIKPRTIYVKRKSKHQTSSSSSLTNSARSLMNLNRSSGRLPMSCSTTF